MPFFSVVIPTYNRLSLLRKAVDSVLTQSFSDFELIVVDDGSTDGTVNYLHDLSGQIKVIQQENYGAGAARNAGAAVASGRYLAFLDSDDLWFHWTMDTYYRAVHENDYPSFVTGIPFIFRHTDQLSNVTQSDFVVEAFDDYYCSSDAWRWFSASSFVIRRDAFEEVDGFHDQWGAEDSHLAMKLGMSRGFVHLRTPFTFAYREQETSLQTEPTYCSSGADILVSAERNGEFPGGLTRKHQRWEILTRHIRPTTFDCMYRGMCREAWSLYMSTLSWNAALGRWKYILGFPLIATTRKLTARNRSRSR